MEQLPPPLLSRLSLMLAGQMGLHFPEDRFRDLQRGLAKAAREFGFDDVRPCAEWLLSAPLRKEQVDVLAGHLTVGETYFFREPKTLEILQTQLLPALIEARRGSGRRLRIWSAACCTGEEPYTLAIILRQLLPDIADWHVTVLATDLNPRFLARARAGVYADWSFRNPPPWLKDRYFHTLADGRHQIAPEIRKMVTFMELNLVDDAFPSLLNNTNAMDIIFCRNVLMYFAQEQSMKVVSGLRRSLVDGGWLVVSPSEFPHLHSAEMAAVNFGGVILYRRDAKAETPGGTAPPPARGGAAVTPMRVAAPAAAAPSKSVAAPPKNAAPAAAAPLDRAQALYQEGRYDDVAKLLRGVPSSSLQPRAADLLARAQANAGRLDEALAACDHAVATDRMHAAHHYLRATVLVEQGRLAEAAESLRRAIYLEPDFVLAHFAQGNLFRAQGREGEAMRHYRNALALLDELGVDEVVPESDGMTAGRMAAVIGELVERRVA